MRHQKQKHHVQLVTKVWKSTYKPKAQRACLRKSPGSSLSHTLGEHGRPCASPSQPRQPRGRALAEALMAVLAFPEAGAELLAGGIPKPTHQEEGSGVATRMPRE